MVLAYSPEVNPANSQQGSVMSATIAPNSAAVSAAASLASTANAGPSGSAEGLSAGQQGLPGSFAALVKQLAGKPAEAGNHGSNAASLILPGDTSETADALAALLPFLEAMGLTQPNGASGSEKEDTAVFDPAAAEFIADAGNLATLAAPINAPAIPAGNLPAAGGEELPLNLPTISQAGTAAATIAPDAQETANAKPAVIEFSSQLAKAVESGSESAHLANGASVALPAAAHFATPGQAATHSLPVPQAVGAPGWDREVGNQVAWLAHQTGGKAELVLTPPQMGRIEVSLTVSGDQASASFVSANPVVREALEAALPRLREVLAEAGIQLGQAQVGAENMRQSAQQEKNGDNPAADHAPGSIAAMQAAGHALPAAGLKIGRGLVDVFA
jgi:flagellar hook-length control protein FliK